jgi:hypothetical protein
MRPECSSNGVVLRRAKSNRRTVPSLAKAKDFSKNLHGGAIGMLQRCFGDVSAGTGAAAEVALPLRPHLFQQRLVTLPATEQSTP